MDQVNSTELQAHENLLRIGNVDLVFPVPASGSNPSINSNFQLSSNLTGACPVVNSGSSGSGKLVEGSSCVLPISFAPTSKGTLSGSLILTDNNLNAAGPEYTSQGISLSGVGESVTAAIVSRLSGSTLAGSSATFSWTAQTGSTPLCALCWEHGGRTGDLFAADEQPVGDCG